LTLRKILIFTDWYVPAYKAGGPITSIKNLVKLLSQDYDCYIVCGDRDLGDDEPFNNISTNEWINGKNGEHILYLNILDCTRNNYKNIIKDIQPELIYYNSLYSKNFTLKPLLFFRNMGISSFLSPRGMLHPAAFEIKNTKKQFFINILKRLPLFKKVIFLATDEIEKAHIVNHGFKNAIKIVPNIPDLALVSLPLQPKQTLNKIITVSRIAPEKNSLLALETISKLKETINYYWIGDSKDSNYLNTFLQQAKALPANITFNYLGALPKQTIIEELMASDIFFLPTLGENFGHAIYEALAVGLPCVISNKTPFQLLEKEQAGFMGDPNDREGFKAALSNLLNLDKETISLFQSNAKNLAIKSFDKEAAIRDYKGIWG